MKLFSKCIQIGGGILPMKMFSALPLTCIVEDAEKVQNYQNMSRGGMLLKTGGGR